MTSRASTPPLPAAILFAYLGFIVYGSLVPLDFTPQSIAAAWQQFQQIRMLQLGVESRADWIANGILYIPAGLLAAEWLSGLLPPRARIVALLLALVGCSVLAIGVEFTQIFFPPRTVSQNDIIAECLGSLTGVALAACMDHWLRQLVAYRPASREAGITLLLAAYLVAYLAFSLFPYDVLLSSAELAAKFNSDQWGILLAGSKTDGRLVIRLARISLEFAAAIPFGIFMIRRAKGGAPSPASVLLPGALLGLGIEVAQFFIYTGSSEGLSVITRSLGAYAGALLWLRGKHLDATQIATFMRRASLVLAPLYLVGLAAVSGWFREHWQSPGAAMTSFEATHLMPFYYHYYTSEAIALSSLVSNAALYAPVGIVAWAWNRPGSAAAVAALLALIIETSHLFFTTTHADPTNLLIAATAAWATTSLAGRLFASTGATVLVPEEVHAADPPPSQAIAKVRPALAARHLATLVLAGSFSTYWLAHFPLQPLALALGLAACAMATWLRPIVVVALIPAALPILDLAPWSGRFFLDEFDILLLITLAIGYVRVGPAPPGTPGNKLLNLALGLLALSFVISSVRALIPLPSLDANSFTSYFSPFNALRISKGLLWAILFIGLVRRIDPAGKQSFRWFAGGITLGLSITAAVVIREKELFGGLLDFSTEYRATGPFSAIHTGGAYIEAYIVAAVPFLIFATLHARSWLGRMLGTVAFVASTYALIATISRGGFAAYAIACGLAFVAALAGRRDRRLARLSLSVVLAALALALAIPLTQGSFVQQRLASIATDLAARRAHWADGMAMRQDGLLTEIFGMGIGRFPITHYLASRETASRTAIHTLATEAANISANPAANTFLRIAPGNALYVEQIIALEPRQHYLLQFDVRSATPTTDIGISVCEKWLLASNRCAGLQKATDSSLRAGWHHLEYGFDSGELGTGDWLGKRPIKLSFYSGGPAIADIDNIRLARATGPELVVNGDFSRGMDRWYFATDHDLAWHLHSTPVAILFDQGWFGVLCWAAFAAIVLGLAIRAAWHGNAAAAVYVAATVGCIVVSLLGAVIDTPRLLFLCIVLGALGAHQRQTRRASIHTTRP